MMHNIFFASGDSPFFYEEQLSRLSWLPNVWDAATGLGQNVVARLWIDYPFRLVLKVLSAIGLSWFVIEKLLWLSVVIIGLYSSYCLARYILQSRLSSWITSAIFISNTYFLLLFGGGQLGVALAYAFAPFVLLKFIQIDNKEPRTKNKEFIKNGIWLAILAVFDLRLACLLFGTIILYQIFSKRLHLGAMGISLFIAALIHAFWILPTMMTRTGPSVMGEDFTNPGMLKFLSFADFSHALSLLHPNWPENIFGKTYFLQQEFLIMPLLAFGSLLTISKIKKQKSKIYIKNQKDKTPTIQQYSNITILFFALIGLLGAFFAKGTNPPLGEVYGWMFIHVPGFVMFRDPTKFYLYIAIAYSILIPFTIKKIIERYKINKWIPYSMFILFWLYTLSAIGTGEVKGNFRPIQLPDEYVQLKNKLITDSVASRTLWIPQKDGFAYYSDTHPVLSSSQVFHNASISGLLTIATSSAFIPALSDAGVKYVIVPKDVEGKVFMSGYKHDPVLRQKTIVALQQTALTQNIEYSDIAVFENPDFKNMNITVPAVAKIQQYYASIGTAVSIIFILTFVILYICL